MKTIISALAIAIVTSTASFAETIQTYWGNEIVKVTTEDFVWGGVVLFKQSKVLTTNGQWTVTGDVTKDQGYATYELIAEQAEETLISAKSTEEVAPAAVVVVEEVPAEDNREDNKDRIQNAKDAMLNALISNAKAGNADPIFTTVGGKSVDLREVSFAKYGRFYFEGETRTIVTAIF